MARPYKRTFLIRSPEEKERIILEYLNDKHPSQQKTCEKYDIDDRLFSRWIKKYREFGIKGLINNTGKAKSPSKGNPLSKLQRKKHLSKEEQLELENMKLKIEVARLKKGYQVKGVGSKKEYVTIKDLNTKS